ncbi:YrdB family protein [Kitasatospora sp. NPDC052896]|uniref:YrdB family protein n=1 Tax=Kitasatospora sp. NPDC052896 TaxID=3364061 RepID=UPI0037C7901E
MTEAKGPGPLVPDGRAWYVANEILAFLLELVALGLLCWWGFATGGGLALRVLLGVCAPLLAIVLWGLFAAPRARLRPALPGVLLVKALVLGGSAAALYGVGHPVAAVVVGAVMVANTALAETARRAAPGGD